MAKGILKNVASDAPYRTQSPNEVSLEPLDRQEVIANTRHNAQMHGQNPTKVSGVQPENDCESHLKWDERNLLVNEMEKTPKMKIDEPKTPYEGGFNPENDYYKMEPLDDMGLGEGVDDADVELENVEVVTPVPVQASAAEARKAARAAEPEEVNIEDDISAFEGKRRMHYKTEGNPLHQLPPSDEEDEE